MTIKLSKTTFIDPESVVSIIAQFPIEAEIGDEANDETEEVNIPAHVVIYMNGKQTPVGLKTTKEGVINYTKAVASAVNSKVDVSAGVIKKYCKG